ncbi:MAG: alpha-L-rhamnosidase-related protein [Planctomycetota bacterium]|jgi:hypothetical protein
MTKTTQKTNRAGFHTILALCVIVLVVTSPAVKANNSADQQKHETAKPLGEVSSDALGSFLQSSMIWIPESGGQKKGICAAFRKSFDLSAKATRAKLHIFADSHYLLWINGRYVLRGPCRFDPKHPQYDTVNVERFLSKGRNTLAVLVTGRIKNGRIIMHAPGLGAKLQVTGNDGNNFAIATDKTWRCTSKIEFQEPTAAGGTIRDNVDATRIGGDWRQGGFDDSDWHFAVAIDPSQWGPFHQRSIPLLRETELSEAAIVQVVQNQKTDNTPRPLRDILPLQIKAPAEVVVDIGQLAQAYWILDFDADQGSEFTVKPCQRFRENKKPENNYSVVNVYKARSGSQQYMSSDTYGFRYMHLQLTSGVIRLQSARFVDVTYPFVNLGRFESNDRLLNELWKMATYTVQVCSEDSYVDCALRERSEWMGDGAVVTYPISRVAFAGPGQGRDYTYSDPRLIRVMLERIALTQKPDGRIRANTCSDFWDMHSFIEDYCCLWVQSLRQYYDNTGDIDFVRQLWPVLDKQMKWFLERRTEKGLVKAREFLLHMDNPLHHQTDCEGATLNAFVFRALRDSAYLAEALGRKRQSGEYNSCADQLAVNYNQHLWDPNSQTYYAGIKQGRKVPPTRWVDPVTKVYWQNITQAKEYPPTVQAALLALDRGIVPADRLNSVRAYLLKNYHKLNNPYTHFFLFEELYKINSAKQELDILNVIRKRWAHMVENKDPGTLIEKFKFGRGGSSCHNFGSVPAYFLSTYVLGVRTDGPVWEKRIIIKPGLADLEFARGVVVTEHGPVPVSWTRDNDTRALNFTFEIPPGVQAKISIPKLSDKPTLIVDKKVLLENGIVQKKTKLGHRFVTLQLGPGKHSGRIDP